VLRVNGSPEQKQRLYAEVLAGQRFGNALAELGTKTAHDRVTRLTRDGDGYRINGRKFYATGAIYAQRIRPPLWMKTACSNWRSSRATAKA
jgi:alkylation response protein AidB-like acyl-CoA dehydrogenase